MCLNLGFDFQRFHFQTKHSCRNIILALGITFVIFGVSIDLFWNTFFEYEVKKELILSKSSKSHDLWVENHIPLYINFYFFNWTNPSDLRISSNKPHFQELGPYRFQENVKKVGLKWNKNGTVTYKKLRTWFFDPEGSNGSLNDEVTTLNVIALMAARSTQNWNRIARIPLSLMLSATQKMSITKKVREFLFEGFTDPLMEFASKIPGLSSQVPYDKFGWFYKRNGTEEFDGVFNVETGANGLEVFGKLRFWNYSNHTSFYEDRCGSVLGSAGDFWPPVRSIRDNIMLFSPDMCRFISFKFSKEDFIGNLKGYRYDSGPELFDNGTIDPKNLCFCQVRCTPLGTANLSKCRFGAPAFVSYPHFYLADPSYLNSVSGLKSDPRKHDMYIILEQVWGIPLEVSIRLQINVLIESDPEIRMYNGVHKIFFPMIWFEQKVSVPEAMRSQIKFLSDLSVAGPISSIICYVVGSICVITFFLMPFLIRKKGNKTEDFTLQPKQEGLERSTEVRR